MRFSVVARARSTWKTHAKRVMSTYLIVDSTPRDGVFITNFGFLIFPRFPIISGELIRTLASENKNPTILNMIGFRFIFDARLLIPAKN